MFCFIVFNILKKACFNVIHLWINQIIIYILYWGISKIPFIDISAISKGAIQYFIIVHWKFTVIYNVCFNFLSWINFSQFFIKICNNMRFYSLAKRVYDKIKAMVRVLEFYRYKILAGRYLSPFIYLAFRTEYYLKLNG